LGRTLPFDSCPRTTAFASYRRKTAIPLSARVGHTTNVRFLVSPSHGARDLVAIELVEPAYDQLIGLVLTDRDPFPPMAHALTASLRTGDFENGLTMALRS
jgi:hypothetical protein